MCIRDRVYWHNRRGEWEDPCLYRGFQRRECIRRPRCWIVRKMMYPVKPAEELPVMHQPMGPIEVRIVEKNRADDAQPEPGPAVLRDGPVELHVAVARGNSGNARNSSEDHHRKGGVAHLAPDFARLG